MKFDSPDSRPTKGDALRLSMKNFCDEIVLTIGRFPSDRRLLEHEKPNYFYLEFTSAVGFARPRNYIVRIVLVRFESHCNQTRQCLNENGWIGCLAIRQGFN